MRLFTTAIRSFNSKTKQEQTRLLSIQQKRAISDFLELTKFKLSSLNSIGAWTMFYYHAPLAGVGLLETATFLFATQTIAMSTQTFGQVKEAELDAKMARTKNRPMVLGRYTSQQACFIGTGLTVSSLLAYHMFYPFTWVISNTVWFSYLCLYLPMKQKSEYNTLMGAVVGALPPFIGTFAQTGCLLDPATLYLAAYIFSWQFPHFYGILYEHKDDYKKAGFVMTSNDDPQGDKTAHKQILGCTMFNTLVPIAMTMHGILHPVVLLPFLATQIRAFQAVQKFKEDKASAKASKGVKIASYPPFMILLVGFLGTTAFKKYEARRDSDERQWDMEQ